MIDRQVGFRVGGLQCKGLACMYLVTPCQETLKNVVAFLKVFVRDYMLEYLHYLISSFNA